MSQSFITDYLNHLQIILRAIEYSKIEQAVTQLNTLRNNQGRLFILGVGGSAANAAHAVNDFRKICQINAYAPTDNVAELTARTNDQGWELVFSDWLLCSQLQKKDCVMIFSVGGGSREHNLSVNLINAIDLALSIGSPIIAFTGAVGGYAALKADIAIKIPCEQPKFLTPVTESLHSVLWHMMVSHPLLKSRPTQWEAVNAAQ